MSRTASYSLLLVGSLLGAGVIVTLFSSCQHNTQMKSEIEWLRAGIKGSQVFSGRQRNAPRRLVEENAEIESYILTIRTVDLVCDAMLSDIDRYTSESKKVTIYSWGTIDHGRGQIFVDLVVQPW